MREEVQDRNPPCLYPLNITVYISICNTADDCTFVLSTHLQGFEWNKYNQTHYDTDNPPPKIVQGYKFNVTALLVLCLCCVCVWGGGGGRGGG